MTLHLKRGETLLGLLNVYEFDQPWFICHFEPTTNYDGVRALFDQELQLLEAVDIDVEAWEFAYQAINDLGLRLLNMDSREEIDKFLLHIQGDEALFRY